MKRIREINNSRKLNITDVKNKEKTLKMKNNLLPNIYKNKKMKD